MSRHAIKADRFTQQTQTYKSTSHFSDLLAWPTSFSLEEKMNYKSPHRDVRNLQSILVLIFRHLKGLKWRSYLGEKWIRAECVAAPGGEISACYGYFMTRRLHMRHRRCLRIVKGNPAPPPPPPPQSPLWIWAEEQRILCFWNSLTITNTTHARL